MEHFDCGIRNLDGDQKDEKQLDRPRAARAPLLALLLLAAAAAAAAAEGVATPPPLLLL